jgi:hypothetical protein
MPLNQPLPTTWSSQHLIIKESNSNMSANDFIISCNGVKHGTSGKTYIATKMPFCTFYLSNQGAGTAVVVFSRVSDGTPLYATAVQPITSTTGDQFRSLTLPCDDVNSITISVVKTGTISLSIVASGLTDSGLLPDPVPVQLQSSNAQKLTLSAGRAVGGSQVAMSGGSK